MRHELLENRSLLAGMVGDSPWQNPLDPTDLNCDGSVSPSDALVAINAINGGLTGDLSHKMAPPDLLGRVVGAATDFMDADGDGQLSPSDALTVINAINQGWHLGSLNNVPTDDLQPGTPGPDAQQLDVTHGFAKVRSAINTDGDVDVFQVTPTKTQLNVALFSAASGPLHVSVVTVTTGDSGPVTTEIGSAATIAGSHAPAKVNVDVTAGTTYYVVVKGDAGVTGLYGLGVLNYNGEDFTPKTDSPLGTDIHDSTPAKATTLTFDHTHAQVVSNVDSAGDSDMFKLDATDGKLVVTAGAAFPLTVQVTDSNGKVLGTITSSDRSVLSMNVATGSYYVSIAAANGTDTGAYRLDVVNAAIPRAARRSRPRSSRPADAAGVVRQGRYERRLRHLAG